MSFTKLICCEAKQSFNIFLTSLSTVTHVNLNLFLLAKTDLRVAEPDKKFLIDNNYGCIPLYINWIYERSALALRKVNMTTLQSFG